MIYDYHLSIEIVLHLPLNMYKFAPQLLPDEGDIKEVMIYAAVLDKYLHLVQLSLHFFSFSCSLKYI